MWHCGAADAAQSAPSLLLPLRAEQGACTGGWRAQPARAAWQRWHGRTASTQAATRATESTGSNGALLVASRCERPASPPPLAGSHPRRTGGTPCGRAASAMSKNVSMSVQGEAGQPWKRGPSVLHPLWGAERWGSGALICAVSSTLAHAGLSLARRMLSRRRSRVFYELRGRSQREASRESAREMGIFRVLCAALEELRRWSAQLRPCLPLGPDAGCCHARPDSRPP